MHKTVDECLVVYRSKLEEYREWVSAVVRCEGSVNAMFDWGNKDWKTLNEKNEGLKEMASVLGLTEEEVEEIDIEIGIKGPEWDEFVKEYGSQRK